MKPTVFVVDDDDAVRDSTTVLLESAGHRVQSFADPRDFLEVVDKGMTGCVIIDHFMPGLSGLDVVDRLLADKCGLPVILLTGNADEVLETRAAKKGVFRLLEKPFRADRLLELIEEACP